MSDIKIFMCCHKPFEFVPPMCTPIQCGSALHEKIRGAVYDDNGDNISEKITNTVNLPRIITRGKYRGRLL